MTEQVVKIILLFTLCICLTQAVALKSQVSQQPLNSLDESQTKSVAKEKTSFNYDHVSDLNNHVLDNFDHRYPDGSYEFRYELADGQARYERGYFIKINNHKSLVVVGYYSYRMPDGQYITVFYNADQYGYRQNQAITRETLPDLPRTIEIPGAREYQSDDDTDDDDVTTKKSVAVQGSSTTKQSRF